MNEEPTLDQRKAEVRRRLSLASVVEKHVVLSGSSASTKRRGKCPFHGSNSASFALFDADKGDGRAFCFGCQWQGDLFRFVQDIRGIGFMDALAELEAEACIAAGGEAPSGTGPVQRERNPARRRRPRIERIEPIDMGRWIWGNANPDDRAVRRYMRGRGVPAAALTPARLSAFRYLADCPVAPWAKAADPRSELVAPAVVALVQAAERDDDGALQWRALGVHVTYLDPAGTGTMKRRKPWVPSGDPDPWLPKRRMLGPVGHGAVVLGDYAPDAALWVGEGNETVLSAMGLGQADEAAVGIATLSLDNLQGHPKLWNNRTWPLFAIEPDPARPCFTVPGHRGSVTGLVDSDMAPLRGKRTRGDGEFLGENVVERKGGPLVHRAITGAERARICGELVVKGWRAAGVHRVSAVRAPIGMDFNDAAAAKEAAA